MASVLAPVLIIFVLNGTGFHIGCCITLTQMIVCPMSNCNWILSLGHLQIAKISSEGRKSLGEVMSGPALALLEAAPDDLWPRLQSLCNRAISSVGQVRSHAPPNDPLSALLLHALDSPAQ